MVVIAALFAAIGWAVLWRPAVTLDEQSIVVRNVFRTVTVPWAALIHVDTKYALTLVTPHQKVTALAAPAPGRHVVMWANREDVTGLPERTYDAVRSVRPGDLARSHSGQAAILVRRRWEDLVESGRLDAGVAASTPVTTVLHVPTIVGAVLLAGVALVVFVR
ncbi:hypothetical protein GCM10011512_18200 [Tersicoccus solisilvae]|uniref:Low molecular weight protein antigen 6 PH domain-containing protein n=2 Tax=Tersicoccus solisilvae TaxID=1882339 RepID=A0ABQ1P9G4_9MICC|nr:hypothetical protein GCM10011512_18200 [Tersicoccus solisilvae]